MDAAEQEELLRTSVLIFAGLILCEKCSKVTSPFEPVFTDEEYAATAHRLLVEGWTTTDCVNVYCPSCSPLAN